MALSLLRFAPLLKSWRFWVVAVILSGCVGIYIYIGSLQRDILTLQLDMKAQETLFLQKEQVYVTNTHTLQQAIDEQNHKTQLMATTLRHAETTISQSIKQSELVRKSYDRSIHQLKLQAIPQTCDESFQYLADSIPGIGWLGN